MDSAAWTIWWVWRNDKTAHTVNKLLQIKQGAIILLKIATEREYIQYCWRTLLRLINRSPEALVKTFGHRSLTPLTMSQELEVVGCVEMYPILALTPKFIAQTPFNKLLQKHLLEKYNEIFGQYNCMVWFLHRSFAPDSRSAMVKRRSTRTLGLTWGCTMRWQCWIAWWRIFIWEGSPQLVLTYLLPVAT